MHLNTSFTSHSTVQLFYRNPKHRAFLMTGKVFIGPVPTAAMNINYPSRVVPPDELFLW